MQRPKRYGAPDPETQDGIPVEMPLGYMAPTPLHELIASMVRQERMAETGNEMETEEEANDFEEENPDLLDMSPFTLTQVDEEEPLAPTPEEGTPPPAKPAPATPDAPTDPDSEASA